MTTTADVVAASLADAGVRTVFGVVGTTTMDLADALVRHPALEFVSAREEEAAAHMADGYARVTGRVGVTLAHVGPGALRQMYGIGTAWKDSVPLVALTGNEMLRMTDSQLREAYHVVDVLDLYRPITKATLQLRDRADARSMVDRALWLASSGRPGPVLLDLPKNVLRQDLAVTGTWSGTGDRVPPARPRPSVDDVRMAANALRHARCPVLYAGGGVHWSGAAALLTGLAERTNLPVVTTDGGRGAVPEDHPLAIGVVARQSGDDAARELLADADVVLAVGSPFSDVSTVEWSAWSTECDVFRVDIAPDVGHKGVSSERTIVADAHAFLTELTRELDAAAFGCPHDWSSRRAARETERDGYLHTAGACGGDGVSPWRVIGTLDAQLPRNALLSIDSGMHSFFGKKLRVLEPRSYVRSAGFGAMGYSFPALLGALHGAPGRRGVAIVGDGCLAMCLGEFETAARLGSPVTVVVFNDAAFASQRSHQRRRFDGRLTGTTFGRTDFVKIAEAQGVPGRTVTTGADVERAVSAALAADGPNVIDVHVDPAVTPPTWIEGSGDARAPSASAESAGGRR